MPLRRDLVTSDAEPLAQGICHCTDCRRQAGTASSVLGGAWITAGTLDDPTWLEPELEVWTDSRLPWIDAVEHEERGCFPRGLPT